MNVDNSGAVLDRPRLFASGLVDSGQTVLLRAPYESGARTAVRQWLDRNGRTSLWWTSGRTESPAAPSGKPDVVVVDLRGNSEREAATIVSCRERWPSAGLVVIGRFGWPLQLTDGGQAPEYTHSGRDLAFTPAEIAALGELRGVALSDHEVRRLSEATWGLAGPTESAIAVATRTGRLDEAAIREGMENVAARFTVEELGGRTSTTGWTAFVAMGLAGTLSPVAVSELWGRDARGSAFLRTLRDGGLVAEVDAARRLALPPVVRETIRRSDISPETKAALEELVQHTASRLIETGRVEPAMDLVRIVPEVRRPVVAPHWRRLSEQPAPAVQRMLSGLSPDHDDPRLLLALVRALIDVTHRGHTGRIASSHLQHAELLLGRIEQRGWALGSSDAPIAATLRAVADRLRGDHHSAMDRLDRLVSDLPGDHPDRAVALIHSGMASLELGRTMLAQERFAATAAAAGFTGNDRLRRLADQFASLAAFICEETGGWWRGGGQDPESAELEGIAQTHVLWDAVRTVDLETITRILTRPHGSLLDDPVALRLLDLQTRIVAHTLAGTPRSALAEVDHAEATIDAGRLTAHHREQLAVARSEALLAADHPARARAVLDEFVRSHEAGSHLDAHLARCELALGDPEAAAARLADVLDRTGRQPSGRLHASALVLMYQAQRELGEEAAAGEMLESALITGARADAPLVFARQGSRALTLLLADARRARLDPAAAAFVERLMNVRDAMLGSAPAAPLTIRERLILGLLAESRTTPGIAAMLHVSPNTVKTQVRSIYRKLGVSSRMDALNLARAGRLLPETNSEQDTARLA